MDVNLEAVCGLLQEYFALHPDPQRESKISTTLAAFYIFYKRAADYAKLSAASLSKIQQCLVTLLDTATMLPTPDCPELESRHDDIHVVLFQKINRYLFEELDTTLEHYLNAEIPDVSTISSLFTLQTKILLPLPSLLAPLSSMSELPVPPIEWATNILEELDYTIYLNHESSSSLSEWMKTIVDKHYDPTCLIHYLQLGWNAVLARYFEVMTLPGGTPDHVRLLDTFVDRLRNTMCYPVRVSILTCSLA